MNAIILAIIVMVLKTQIVFLAIIMMMEDFLKKPQMNV